MRKHVLRVVLGVTILAGQVWGQSVLAPEVENPSSEGGSFFLRGGYGHRFESDFDDWSGKFATNDARGEVGGTAVLGSGVTWLNALGYGYNNYDADNVDGDVHNLNAASIFGWELNPCWKMLAGPLANVYAEDDADWGDSISYGGLLGAVFSESSELSVGLAAAAMRRIGGGLGITPIPLVDWRFAPDWLLHTGVTEVAARRGIGGFLQYSIGEGLALAAGAQFEQRRFRLDEVGAQDKGFIAEDKSTDLYARLTWNMSDCLALDIFGGAAVGGKLKVNDEDGDYLASDKYDPVPLVGARLRYELSGL